VLNLKTVSAYHRPWPAGVPVEDTNLWPAFLKTAEIVREMHADPRSYLIAQFEGIRWTSQRVPFPNQLCTDNARLRFIDWFAKNKADDDLKAKPEHAVAHPFKREQLKLDALVRRYAGQLTPKQVLRLVPDEFSQRFLASKGVESVQCED
jgi:hypothetical protein